MKFAHTTILAILATSALVSAAPTEGPTATSNSGMIVKREDVNQVMQHLNELKSLKVKRDNIADDETAMMELDKRADSVLSNLITSLAQSGLISVVFDDLTSSAELKSSIVAIIKSTLQASLAQGPTLIKGIWQSGLLTDVFNLILKDSDLRSSLLAAGKALFSTTLNLIENFYGGGSSGSQTAGSSSAATSAAAAYKREDTVVEEKRSTEVEGQAISERDLLSIVSFIVTEIKSSGIVSNLINKVMADPSTAINFLSSALKTGAVYLGDVYNWAKSSGLLQEGISYLQNSDSGIVSTLASFLGNSISSGDVSSSEFDGASSSAAADTVATTGGAAATTTTNAATTGTVTDMSFLTKYAEAGATTLYKAKRMVY